MFLRNVWYVAGFSADLKAGERVARRFLNEPIVLFRGASGVVGAIEDRCCHRALPLSEGHVDGDILRCFYHGLEFDASGACTKVPGQDRIPSQAFVRSYPIVEHEAVMWIWMGDPAEADPALIPSHPHHVSDKWSWQNAYFHVGGNWELLIENLMDLSHLGYVHARTIGGNAAMHFKTPTIARREGNKVYVQRHMPNSIAPPTYVDAAGFKGPIDRWQEIEFEPVLVRVHTGACDAGTGAYEGKREHGFSMMGFHGITPETETTTHYFWSLATNVLDRGVPKVVFDQTEFTFREDLAVLEAQQKRISETPGGKFIDIGGDVGGNLAKRLLRQLHEAEGQTGIAAE